MKNHIYAKFEMGFLHTIEARLYERSKLQNLGIWINGELLTMRVGHDIYKRPGLRGAALKSYNEKWIKAQALTVIASYLDELKKQGYASGGFFQPAQRPAIRVGGGGESILPHRPPAES